jgi:hypothetical protein
MTDVEYRMVNLTSRDMQWPFVIRYSSFAKAS